MRWLCGHSLEKGVAEHAIGFCRTIKIADPRIECRGIDDAGGECLLPYGFNHPRERFPRETVDQIRCRRVNVDDAWGHAWRLIARLHEQRIQLPADTGIPAGPPLELHLTRDRPVPDPWLRMEVRGRVIECDDLRSWTSARETGRLRAGAAADLEHATAGRKPGIPMEQAHDRGSLRQQTLALALAVSMDIHTGGSSAGGTPAS